VAGAGAGVITRTSNAPFDRLKILYQTNDKHINRSNSIFQNVSNVYKKQGFMSFYRGNGVNIIKSVPSLSLKFTINDYFKTLLWNKKDNLTVKQLVPVGLLTGSSLIMLTYPLDLLRTRFAISSSNQSITKYTRNVLSTEGIRGLYKGLPISLLVGSFHIGIQLSCYDIYKTNLKRYIDHSMATNMLCGAGAGLTAQVSTFPGDVIRKKMHIDGKLNEKRKYANTIDCIKKTIRTEGLRKGVYSGLTVSAIKTIPSASIQFASFEFLKKMLI
jgi:hypothetical protein